MLTMQIEAFLVSVTETVITPFSLSSRLMYQPLFFCQGRYPCAELLQI
jgi:hypothetical protein